MKPNVVPGKLRYVIYYLYEDVDFKKSCKETPTIQV